MKVVIDIPKHTIEEINKIKLDENNESAVSHALTCIKHGTPLPKGHGRLIDISPYEKKEKHADPWVLHRYVGKVMRAPENISLCDLLTVIEADNGE